MTIDCLLKRASVFSLPLCSLHCERGIVQLLISRFHNEEVLKKKSPASLCFFLDVLQMNPFPTFVPKAEIISCGYKTQASFVLGAV